MSPSPTLLLQAWNGLHRKKSVLHLRTHGFCGQNRFKQLQNARLRWLRLKLNLWRFAEASAPQSETVQSTALLYKNIYINTKSSSKQTNPSIVLSSLHVSTSNSKSIKHINVFHSNMVGSKETKLPRVQAPCCRQSAGRTHQSRQSSYRFGPNRSE